ncbi:MAG TPA: MFS transporter [Verrucomicrobiae bacterium]|nr:MFS transporter [Verrucomicrobiae bacterium]
MFYWPILYPLMSSRGLDLHKIGLFLIFSNCITLLLEIPSGLLADRWSRKGVALASIGSLLIGTLLLSRAQVFLDFLLSAVFVSAYFALSSGMKEAMMYDLLLEYNERPTYEKQLGRLKGISAIGNIVSSLCGGLIAAATSFAVPFYMTAVSCVLAIPFLLRFKEPQLHKEVETSRLLKHIADLFRYLGSHKEMRWLVITSVLAGIEFSFMSELDQFWPLALGLALAWYGPLNALLMVGIGLAEPIAAWTAKNYRRSAIIAAASIIAAVGLLIENIWIVAFSEFLLVAMATSLRVVLSGRIQDGLPSSHRSGAESAVSTIASLIFIGVTFMFSHLANTYSVFVAAWIVVAVAVLTAIGIYSSLYLRQSATAAPPQNQ